MNNDRKRQDTALTDLVRRKQQLSRTRGPMLSSIAGLRRYLRKVAVEYNISRLNALEQSC